MPREKLYFPSPKAKGGVKSWCFLQGSFGFQKGIRFENLRSVWVFFGKKNAFTIVEQLQVYLGWTFSLLTRVRDITIPSSLPSPPPVDSIGPIFWRQRLAGVCWPRQTSNHRRVAYNCSQAPCLWHAKWQLDLQVW